MKHNIAKLPRHKKVWGNEIWIRNYTYCGKILTLKKRYCCSMHWHQWKEETFLVISGKVVLELGDWIYALRKGDFIHVNQGQLHRFTGIEHSKIIEFSDTHRESDSYRKIQSGLVPKRIFSKLKKWYADKIQTKGGRAAYGTRGTA